jgi:hypothetical protein
MAAVDDMLILGLGAFHHLPPDPDPAHLVSYGYTPEFASRFTMLMVLASLTDLPARQPQPSPGSGVDSAPRNYMVSW